jgi:hypothetical protein
MSVPLQVSHLGSETGDRERDIHHVWVVGGECIDRSASDRGIVNMRRVRYSFVACLTQVPGFEVSMAIVKVQGNSMGSRRRVGV